MWLVSISTVTGNLPFQLVQGDYVVGRTARAHIVIAESTVSRKHARLVEREDVLTVEDLGSSNGTFVNEEAVTRTELKLGDHVRFGSVGCAISATPRIRRAVSEKETTYQIPLPSSSRDKTLINVFTPAQTRVIPLLMQGKSEPEIAEILGKSPHTIHTHIRAIFEKVDVHSREELIVKLVQQD